MIDINQVNELVIKHTAFRSFDELVNAARGYVPTCRIDVYEDMRIIADAYDEYQEARGDLRRAYRVLPRAEQRLIDREIARKLGERRITAKLLETVEKAHAEALKMNAEFDRKNRPLYAPNDYIEVYSNQAMREGCVLAVIDKDILVEYEMPNGTSALVAFTIENRKQTNRKNYSYNAVPKRWLRAIKEAGMTDWIGMGQRSATRIPFPNEAA